jgi:hypothetical protein
MGSFLNGQRSRASSLGDLLSAPEPVLAPGAYDALSARLIEAAGFPAVYMTGFGTAASLLGRPDVGAIHIEDQVAPKKCGHMEGKQLVPAEEMVAKLRAAVAARRSALVLIARTDARAVEGLDKALHRARRYRVTSACERSASASSFSQSAHCSLRRAAYVKFSPLFAPMARPRQRYGGCHGSANLPTSSAYPRSRSWSSASVPDSLKRGVDGKYVRETECEH